MNDKAGALACRNCGTLLTGDYCHVSGQSAEEPRRAVIGLVQDVFVDTLAIDGKLFRTLWLLLTRPGRLARRYLDGKRVRYSPPFRLYLFASVFFFFVAFLIADISGLKFGPDAPTDVSEVQDTVASELARAGVDEGTRNAVASEIDAARETAAKSEDDASTESKSEDQGKSFKDMKWDDADYDGPDWLKPYVRRMFEAGQRAMEDPRLFFAQMQENLPRTMLLAPLLYAFILLVLYVYRRRFLVYDHLVVSLYMHAALYAHLLIALLLAQIPNFGWLAIIPLAWALIQPYAVFRQAYGSNWFSVIAKGFISTTVYAVVFSLLITLGVSFALYQA